MKKYCVFFFFYTNLSILYQWCFYFSHLFIDNVYYYLHQCYLPCSSTHFCEWWLFFSVYTLILIKLFFLFNFWFNFSLSTLVDNFYIPIYLCICRFTFVDGVAKFKYSYLEILYIIYIWFFLFAILFYN